MEKSISIQDIKSVLPKHSRVKLLRTVKGRPYFDIFVDPHLSEDEFETVKQSHRNMLGELHLETDTEETGRHWKVYLDNSNKPVQIDL